MGNLPDSTRINWTLYERGADKKILESHSNVKRSNAKTFDFTKKEWDIATFLSLEAQAETESKPKVEIFIEKDVKKFTYKDLKAIDSKNKNRVAKGGETLYYVHKTGKKYDFCSPTFQIDISPKVLEDEIPTNHIEWIYNGTNIDHDKLSLSRTIHYKDENKGKIEVQARTGNPMAGEYKKVNVEWVDEKEETHNFTGNFEGFFRLFDVVNEVSSLVGKVAPCSAKIKNPEKELIMQNTITLEEDKNSRHILKKDKTEVIIQAGDFIKLKCGKKLEAKILGYGFELGELYAQLTMGANIIINKEKVYFYENNKLKEKNNITSGGFEVKGEVGLTAGVGYKADNKLIIGVLGGGKVNVTGGGKVEYPYKENENAVGMYAYLNPLRYNFSIESKMGPLSFDYNYSDILWSTRLQSDPFILNLK